MLVEAYDSYSTSVPVATATGTKKMENIHQQKELAVANETHRNVQHKPKEPRVQLEAPNPVSESFAEAEEKIKKILIKLKESLSASNKTQTTGSAGFAVQMSFILSTLEMELLDLKKAEIERVQASNMKEMETNQERIQQSEDAIKEAKKSQIAQCCIAWIFAPILIALAIVTGGAAAILMAVAGVVGAVGSTFQLPEVAKTLGKDLAEALNITFMVIQALLMLATAGLGLGTFFATKLSQSPHVFMKNIGQFFSNPTIVSAEVKQASNAIDLSFTVAEGASSAASAGLSGKASNSQADVTDSRAELERLREFIEKNQRALQRIGEKYNEMLQTLLKMIADSGKSQIDIINNINRSA